MSPPIRDGSGSSIGSIRLGDGSEISEVRTGAGDVLFSAAPPIPDSGNLYADYNAIDLQLSNGDTVSTFTDQQNDNDLTASGDPTFRTGVKNGHPTVRYDGSDDYHDASSSDNFGTLSPPFTIYTVIDFDGFLSTFNSTAEISLDSHYVRAENNTWRVDVLGTNSSGGSPSTNTFFVTTWDVDSVSEELFVNGSSVTTIGNSADLNGYAMGYEPEGNEDFMDGDIGRCLVYNTDQSPSTMDEIESFLADQWGITL